MNKILKKTLWLCYQPYKYLVFIPLIIFATCFFVALGVLVVFFINDRVAHATTGVWWARFICYLTPVFVKVSGRENIDPGRSYVIIANHQSMYDILILYGWLGINFKWTMKIQLQKIPVFGFAAEKGGNIFIDRSSPEALKNTLEAARNRMVNGTSIIMLPEGTRSRTGEPGEFKNGAFVIAHELDLHILPISIRNTKAILPPGSLDLFPGKASMVIHKPIDTAGYDPEDLSALKSHARAEIMKGLLPDRRQDS